jgi:hypothetical protein
MPDPFVAQLGRISGPLLAPNLVRNGIDLSFNNDLLLLKTEDFKIGINTTPTDDLTVNSTIRSVTGLAEIGTVDNIIFQSSIISSISGPIEISPTGSTPSTYFNNLVITDSSYSGIIGFNENIIYSLSDNNIILNASGDIRLLADTRIIESDVDTPTLDVQGSIELDGDLSTTSNIFIGDNVLDVVVVNSDFTQDILPGTDLTYDLGSVEKRWANVFVDDWTKISNINTQNALINNQLLIDGVNSVIQPSTPDTDLIVTAATGNVLLDRIQIITNEIKNLNETPLTLTSIGDGYWKIGDSNGFVIPSGTDDERPSNPEVGDTRWNTDQNFVECFDGTSYLLSIGPGKQISTADMEDLGHIYTLMLG